MLLYSYSLRQRFLAAVPTPFSPKIRPTITTPKITEHSKTISCFIYFYGVTLVASIAAELMVLLMDSILLVTVSPREVVVPPNPRIIPPMVIPRIIVATKTINCFIPNLLIGQIIEQAYSLAL